MIKNFKYLSFAILTFIFLISINIIAVFNSKFIFQYFATKNNLDIISSLPFDNIFADYNKIIQYIRNPLINYLNFENFTLSTEGQIHFFDVKVIYTFIWIMAFCTFIFLMTYITYKRFFYDKTRLMSRMQSNLIILRNYLNGLIFGFLALVLSFLFIDFSKAFSFMHELLFTNDYWIFSPTEDSIITILPENFFMLCAIAVIILLIVEILIINISIKNKDNKCNI